MSWQAASFAVLVLVIAGGLAWYERDKPPARILALVATMAALAVVGRLAFAAIPNVKPSTDIVLFAGYALGAVPGFAVGALTALVSNVFFSQGPWTPWQMVGWGAVGVAGALLARALRGREPSRLVLAAVCGVAGLAFGAWMDLYQLTLAAHADLDSYLAISASSLPYNLAHAIGNVVFCLLIGPLFIRSLRRYRRRFEVRWAAPAGVAAGALLLALALPAVTMAAGPAAKAERWLLRAQNADGGFGAAPGQGSSELYSGWSALGLAASNRNGRDVRRKGGRSLAAYLTRAGVSKDIGEVERTILALEASGMSARDFAGADLVAALQARRRANGSYSGYVSYTAFGVLALRAAGVPAQKATIGWLVSAQNADGGFGVAPASASDTDMTGAVLQALAVVGRRGSETTRRAVAWLRAAQNADGGFGQSSGRSSNSQSTSYALQGLVAAGASGAVRRRALGYLRARQRGDGSVAYSSSSSQTPVWVTAQALMALEGKPLPIAEAPRKKRRRSETSTSVEPAAPAAPSVDSGQGAASGDAQDPADPGRDVPTDEEELFGSTTPSTGELDTPAPSGDGGLKLDPAQGEGGANEKGEGGGGPAAWLIALVLAAAVALLFLLRRRLGAPKLRDRLPWRRSAT